MTPQQEAEKREADERTKREMARGVCRNCFGRGHGTAGRYPTLTICPDCNGTGKEPR